jgi:SAM-dependent methyltransferase
MSEDLQNLSFPSEQFDIVTTNEVLEHVPSIDDALAEIHRVLRPGVYHIGTVPFCYPQNESVVRAKIEDGVLIHLTEPEYHGNPVDERGSLVFELPGWNILTRARAAGFSDASIKFVLSTRHGCIADHIGGILILCLQK